MGGANSVAKATGSAVVTGGDDQPFKPALYHVGIDVKQADPFTTAPVIEPPIDTYSTVVTPAALYILGSPAYQGDVTSVARYDLLCHPFYQAWSAGKLTRDDLLHYACEYYHHVAAFPTCLSAFHSRLPDGPLRRRVLMNLCGEEIQGRPHSELWLDFAEGMGAAIAP